jgi:hypothetical protein
VARVGGQSAPGRRPYVCSRAEALMPRKTSWPLKPECGGKRDKGHCTTTFCWKVGGTIQTGHWKPCQAAVAAVPAGSERAASRFFAVALPACLRNMLIQQDSDPSCSMPGRRGSVDAPRGSVSLWSTCGREGVGFCRTCHNKRGRCVRHEEDIAASRRSATMGRR